MREILFRAKAVNRDNSFSYRTKYKNGDWIYGLVSYNNERFDYIEMTNLDGVTGIEADRNSLCQYTTMKDKNGTEIYEGDIIKYSDNFTTGIAVIKFGKYECGEYEPLYKCFGFYAEIASNYDVNEKLLLKHKISISNLQKSIIGLANECEVIGNIYDNPDLLKYP